MHIAIFRSGTSIHKSLNLSVCGYAQSYRPTVASSSVAYCRAIIACCGSRKFPINCYQHIKTVASVLVSDLTLGFVTFYIAYITSYVVSFLS